MRGGFRGWAIMAVAVPVAAAGARKLSERMERGKGPTRASGWLRQGADMIRPQQKKRGLFR
ncbi:hypothetical protein [Melissospora conviva]|uniref:hypothetical protein n=1 Tax=Melissospora conviva TaxID=3388432 RepID=UPI003B80EE55